MTHHSLSTTKPMILVLEDDDNMRDCFCAVFEYFGYDVVAGSDGRDGVDLLQSMTEIPDLIVSDVVMDGMSGLEFLSVMQANASWRDIPVVLTSGMTDSIHKMRYTAYQSPLVAYILKPFEIPALLLAIQQVAPRLPLPITASQ